jgi:hypothetical protein
LWCWTSSCVRAFGRGKKNNSRLPPPPPPVHNSGPNRAQLSPKRPQILFPVDTQLEWEKRHVIVTKKSDVLRRRQSRYSKLAGAKHRNVRSLQDFVAQPFWSETVTPL